MGEKNRLTRTRKEEENYTKRKTKTYKKQRENIKNKHAHGELVYEGLVLQELKSKVGIQDTHNKTVINSSINLS